MPVTNATARGALDELRFLRSLVVRPRSMGAIAPSSPALARKIAEQIDPRTEGMVIELGPGTGVVTDALIARGIVEDRLIAIESDPDMAQLVRERFPKLRVVEGDAYDLERSLIGHACEGLAGVVSGLPLLNQPVARRYALIASALAHLAPGAPFVQFSYGWTPPVPAGKDFTVEHAGFVLANLPPARVWVYRRG
ncbi:MAG TPA: rRNA adenine N-6-methyltransferase family protein [Rhizomicrobium sp.]|nr:rRNA adenine N-6-methyltransferase family protein [Rhizomicrobium sp.]